MRDVVTRKPVHWSRNGLICSYPCPSCSFSPVLSVTFRLTSKSVGKHWAAPGQVELLSSSQVVAELQCHLSPPPPPSPNSCCRFICRPSWTALLS